MVSLEDSQIPPLSSQNPCSPSRIQRSHGRSMRTIRSNLYHTDSRNPSPKPGNSTAVSENLTDSVVDFRLRELAVGYSAAKPVSSMASADAADLLDLSHDFSDFSSFDSDISGELHRLAVAHSFQPLSTPGSPAYDGDGEDLLDLGLGFWAESLVSSSEILENASPESLEPVIAACVECLKSSSASIETKRDAAAKVRLLARHRSDFRTLIGSTGAIPALVPLLRSADSAAQENAATALFNLSLEDSNRLAIAGAGAVKPLVYALRTGTVAAKQNAACAILRLSMAEENRAGIGASGAIPALVALLRGGTSRGKKDALTALYKLCSGERRNKERAVEAAWRRWRREGRRSWVKGESLRWWRRWRRVRPGGRSWRSPRSSSCAPIAHVTGTYCFGKASFRRSSPFPSPAPPGRSARRRRFWGICERSGRAALHRVWPGGGASGVFARGAAGRRYIGYGQVNRIFTFVFLSR